jgi:hypothetical protein
VARNFFHHQESSFREDRIRLGLTGENFDFFFTQIEENLDEDPWASSPLPGAEPLRALLTQNALQDLPPFYLTFSVSGEERKIRYFGLEPVSWIYPPEGPEPPAAKATR